MPKRSHGETKEERWRRKMKKYESRLNKKRLIIYSDNEEDRIEEVQEPDQGWYPSPERATPTRALTPLETVALPESDDDHTLTGEAPRPPVAAAVPAAPATPTALTTPAAPTTGAELEPGDASATVAPTSEDIDPDLLKALGSYEEETTDWGEPILEHIAMRLNPLLLNGLKKEEKLSLVKKYPFPKNLPLTKAPTLNAEINNMVLSESSRNRDKRLKDKQNQLGSTLSGVTKAMSLLMCKKPKILEILSILSDASKLLADSHYLETDTRRALIIPLVDKELINPFKDRKRDEFLFGDKLGELVKNSQGIKKTGKLIQASPANFLNTRGPSSRGGHQQKTFVNRGGGQQQRPYRRRAAPYPQPAPPARHQAYAQPATRRPPPAATFSAPRAPATAASDRTAGRRA